MLQTTPLLGYHVLTSNINCVDVVATVYVCGELSVCVFAGPSQQECGNGVVEGDEECDCGSAEPEVCWERDPCCTPGNCTLNATASCR